MRKIRVLTIALAAGVGSIIGACDLSDQIKADVCAELDSTVAACDTSTTVKVFEPPSPDLFCERVGENPWGVPSEGKDAVNCPGGGWLPPGSVKVLNP